MMRPLTQRFRYSVNISNVRRAIGTPDEFARWHDATCAKQCAWIINNIYTRFAARVLALFHSGGGGGQGGGGDGGCR